MSTIVWAMLVISSILIHYATFVPPYMTHLRVNHQIRTLAVSVALFLRRAGKTLASINAIGLIFICIFQFSNGFDNCYCNSSKLGLGKLAYDVITLLPADAPAIIGAYIGGIVLAGGCAGTFIIWLYLYIDE